MRVILASKSPRRKELLEKLGVVFETVNLDIDERVETYSTPDDYVSQIVLRKGNTASQIYPNDLVICADTIVCKDTQILEKPKNIDEAREMIRLLSDGDHEVLTAVSITSNNETNVFIEKTKVSVVKMTDKEIEEYIATQEPYDKAGGYGIQGIFSKFIDKIDGDYYNVMGLPISRLYQELKKYLELKLF